MPYRRGASFIVTLRAKESFSRLALEFRDPDRQPLGRGEGGNLGRVRSRPAPLDDPQASDEGQPRACRATLQQGRGDRSALRRTSDAELRPCLFGNQEGAAAIRHDAEQASEADAAPLSSARFPLSLPDT